MTNGYFDLGDGKLYYEIAGNESPNGTIVMSHAAFLDGRMWDGQWDVLAREYRVVRYDMLGYGRSALAKGPRARREDLYRLLMHLNIQRAHLLGCSMGGEIVLDMALEHPELVESLVVVNGVPSGFAPQGAPPPYLFEMMEATQQGNIERASELQLRIWVDGPHRTPEQVDAGVRQRASVMNQIFVRNGTWGIADLQPLNPLMPPALQRLRDISARTLIITGTLDHAENLRAADIMTAGIPNATRANINNAAHVPNMEQPNEFNALVLRHLAETHGTSR